MKFLHIADVHLGMQPDAGCAWSAKRGEGIWESFRRVIGIAREEKTDFLLIAGDLFHRQPLLRQLKEVNALFASIPETEVVLVAGNHDYVGKDSYYRGFDWADNVTMLLEPSLSFVEFPEKKTAVYGWSYEKKEIREDRFLSAHPEGTMKYHILLAHGGDAAHNPWNVRAMAGAGFDYVACGHIHKPEILVPGKMAYAGALEPTDETQRGPHGYIKGTIDQNGTKISFVPFARYEYVPVEIPVHEEMTQYDLEETVKKKAATYGEGTLLLLTLTGKRAPTLEFSTRRLLDCGNIVSVQDQTRPGYDLEQLKRTYGQSLIGVYIETMEQKKGSVAEKALDYGLEALLEARRNQ